MLLRKTHPTKTLTARTPSKNRGFTLLEVLIALVVLAVGLLGIAALQLQGLRFTHDAYLRSQVSSLAYEIMDSMRHNWSNATNYVSNYTVPATPGTSACNQANGATAANDLACWQDQINRALPPGGTANITQNGSEYTVTLGWTDRDNDARTVSFTFQPR